MPRTVFLSLLQRKVKGIALRPIQFVEDVWDYLEKVVIDVINRHSEYYYQLQKSTSRAGENLIARMRENSKKHVMEAIEMEKLTDYTCNPEYIAEYTRLMAQQDAFVKALYDDWRVQSTVNLGGLGQIEVGDLRDHIHVLSLAFDLKMRIIAYWRIVLRRMVDTTALHLQFSINNLVNKELDKEIADGMTAMGFEGIERLLVESPSIAGKRAKFSRSVEVLRESKEVVSHIMDSI